MTDGTPARRKILLVIFDGLGDLPIPMLGHATPLEAAHTPVLDRLASEGRCGLVDPLRPGVTVGTQTGTGALMGLHIEGAQGLSRGPVEAAGVGLELARGDIALRVNFATVVSRDGGLDILDRRAGRIQHGTVELAQAVNALPPVDGMAMHLEPLGQHRGVLRISGGDVGADITDTDPGGESDVQRLLPSEAVASGDAAAVRTAAALNAWLLRAHDVLAAHPVNQARAAQGLPPANGLLTRGAGMAQSFESVVSAVGLTGAVVSGDRTVLGMGSLLGFACVTHPSFTGLLDTDIDAKVAAASDALSDHDVVWLHVKGTDIAAHDRNPDAKRLFLERADAALAPLLEQPWVIGVSADHTTDSRTGNHTSDPVPTLVRVPGGTADGCMSFGERACAEGGLGRFTAYELVCLLLRSAGIAMDPLTPARP